MKMETCLRCGTCCKRQLCLVPKYAHSDLSPDFIAGLRAVGGDAAVKAYYAEHSIFQGARCIWLLDNSDGTTTCTAYDRRSETCRSFNPDGGCKIWMQVFGMI